MLKKQSLSIRELLPMDKTHIDHFVFIFPRKWDFMLKADRTQTHAFVDSMNPVNLIKEKSGREIVPLDSDFSTGISFLEKKKEEKNQEYPVKPNLQSLLLDICGM